MIVWQESAELLRRCLGSLALQGADQMVVVRSSDAEFSPSLPSAFPGVRWIAHSGAAELPQLQWLALAHVDSDLTAFLEAPSVAGPGWIAAHREAHQEHPEALACGGPVRPPRGTSSWTHGWHWSDYASYAPGRASGVTRDLSDANVSYKTSQLRSQESLLAQGAWGWRIRSSSPSTSYYESSGWIDYPCPHTLLEALRQRYAAGRAHGTARSLGSAGRIASVVTAPLLPAVLAWRGWQTARNARCGMQYALALPWTLIFHASWTCGEFASLRSRY